MSGPAAFVHGTAILEDEAVVGPETRIWHHAHVRSSANIGSGCVLGKNVFVDAGVTIGARCKVQNNVSIYAGVVVEDDVFIGPSATFTNDRSPRAFAAEWEIVPTVVRTGASIGANATIVCGHELGAYSMVAAGAVVTADVPAYCLVMGNPARPRGWVCRCGAVVSRESTPPPEPIRCDGCRAGAAS